MTSRTVGGNAAPQRKGHPSYFKILTLAESKILIQSRCTGHTWRLVPKGSAVNIFHKHQPRQHFHWQTIAVNLQAAIEEIQGHDDFQKNGRRCPYPVYTREGVVRNGRLFRY